MRKINLNIWLLVCVLMMPLAVTDPAGAVTRYVPSPYPTIQGAIDASAMTGDEIEVAPGDYLEAINFNGKAIRLYGSDGPGVTIIEWDLGSPVVTCNSGEGPGTILEGFIITGGNSYKGGGMYNDGTSPTVTNCIFYENFGDYGGGMYNGYGSNPNVTDCIFQNNSASVWGAGMFNNQSNPTVTNCDFLDNDASWDGGGMFNELSSPTVNDCNFIGNTAAQSGGGMYSKNDSNSTVNNCTFSGNEALGTASEMGGGGMYNTSSSPTLTNCTFSNNTTPHNGGGMYNTNSSNPIMTNCSFTRNTSPGYGGGICNVLSSSPALTNCNFTENEGGGGGGMINSVNCSPSIVNCVFTANSANYGGGIHNNDNSNPIVTNCTFTNNTAITYGGAMRNAGSSPIVTNCILWDDTPDEISNGTSSPVVTYCDVKMPSGTYPGTGNIAANPLFVDAAGGDLRLSSDASPCIDAGNNNAPYLPSTDLAGNPRIVDGDLNGTAIVDMGAYEFQSRLIHNITQDNWYETIQAAINYSNSGDQIEVGPGTYYEAIDFKGKGIRLYSSGGQDVTTIDGTGAYHVVQCVSGEGANTILEGLTITGGIANGAGSNSEGGGMRNSGSSPTVTDCIFIENSAVNGGAIHNSSSSPKVTNCSFTGNRANDDGGGINNISSSPTVTDCIFTENSAVNGGAIHNRSSSPSLTNCMFSGNTGVEGGGMCNGYSNPSVINCTFSSNSARYGGGMDNISSSPKVTNCTFSGNSAHTGGGMHNLNDSSPKVTNCTFSGNSAVIVGGGMYNLDESNPTVTNCTFSGNSASSADGGGMHNSLESSPKVTNCILWGDKPNEIYDYGTSITTVNYSDIQGGWGDPNDPNNTNINADPRFVDAYNPDPNLWNLRLLYDSPCIDAGDSTSLLAVPVLHDLDGKFRYWDIPSIANTGTGLSTFLDMGAYEFQCSGIGGDVNCDGVVDFKDLAILCNNWLTGTEPEL